MSNTFPKLELHETDHGMGGMGDATTKLVARFSKKLFADAWLAHRGFTHEQYGSFYHEDEAKRHCMGCISYTIRNAEAVPIDPK